MPTANATDVIASIAEEMKKRFLEEGSGHDWWHIERVWKMAKKIGEAEGADMFVVELAALLHDIADWKFHDGSEEAGPAAAKALMQEHHVDPSIIDHVCNIISSVSYKGALVADKSETLEAKVVQDADRLDAIGAIGIARAFAYGGHANRSMYDPRIIPQMHADKDAYRKAHSSTINHFHEKLLLLKDRLHTKTAKHIAEPRHRFLEQFLKEFMGEWEGKA